MQPTFARGAASASARFAASSKRASSASRFFPESGAPQARRCQILTAHAWLSNAASIVGMWAAMRARNLSGVTRETAQYFTDPRRAFGHGGERTPKGVEATIAASGSFKRAERESGYRPWRSFGPRLGAPPMVESQARR